ncbi:MAG: ABC transporter ATP-binding protein [Clostridia bacterium]|nr:ABC transporter ATP-binding protein [Clostridia bacterium]
MNESVVSIKGLIKRYGSFTAVGGIDMEVGRGEVFGLLGPNGAGKTTTLECLEGMRKVSGGRLRVAGCDPQSQERALRRKLGVQLQSSALPDSICVGEALTLISAWHGLPGQSDLIRRFEIGDLLKKQYRQLSAGQKRRLHLVLALVNHPEVLVLDEPTAGLDVQSRAQLHEEIRSVKAQGITVLLATHDMAEAEALCDRIAIMIHGKLAVCGTPAEVTAAGSGETRIRLRTAKGSLLPGGDVGQATFVSAKDGYLEWSCRDTASSVTELLRRIQDAGDTVDDLRVERPSLEERFLELVEGAEQK